MILIVGATGANGREILELLVDSGQQIRAMVRDPDKAVHLARPKVQWVKGDLAIPATIDSALKGIRKAFIVTPVDPHAAQWLINFIEAARRAGTSHVVKFSVMGADAQSNVQILRQHGGTDQLLIRSGLDYTILRPNSFFQNLLKSADAVRKEGKLHQSIQNARISMIDARDVAQVAFKALVGHGHYKKIYTLTGPEAITFDDIAGRLSTVIARPVQSVQVPFETARMAMIGAGVPEWNARAVTDLFIEFSKGTFAPVTADAQQVLGRPPRSLDHFLRDFGREFW